MDRSELIDRLSQLAFDYASDQIYYQEKADEAEEKYNIVSDRVQALSAADEADDEDADEVECD
ncbi:hypothetical protein ACEPMY_01245 [Ralstonia pseudosolanacearum]|uniref:hypothetical protein n=1 Tax=Ralstonia pseudosolanacearum TaxID=1310165 RepID=UPI00386A18F8